MAEDGVIATDPDILDALRPTSVPRLIAQTSPKLTDPRQTLYVGEFEPFTVLTRVDEEYFHITTPYIVAAFAPDRWQLYLTCRTAPLSVEDTHLHHLPMPHITNTRDGRVCMGPPFHHLGANAFPIDVVTMGLMHYFETGFWYYYVEPELQKLDDSAPTQEKVSTWPQYKTKEYVKKNFTWWEGRTLEQILAMRFQHTTDLAAWINDISPAEIEYLM